MSNNTSLPSPAFNNVSIAGALSGALDQGTVGGSPLSTIPAQISATQIRAVMPFNSTLAASQGGYGLNAIVPDSATPGAFWVSTVSGNLSPPSAQGGTWSALSSFVSGCLIATRLFTTSGVYTPTPGTRRIRVRLQGGGGAGGGTFQTAAGQVAAGWGGQAGMYAESGLITSAFSGVQMAVGAAGAPNTGGGPGGAGGSTSFGSLLTASGGAGGAYGANNAAALLVTGFTASSGTAGGSALFRQRAGGLAGGPIILSATSAIGGFGADSELGRGGAAGSWQQSPGGASGYGGGGASLASGPNQQPWGGGYGSPGVIIVEEYA